MTLSPLGDSAICIVKKVTIKVTIQSEKTLFFRKIPYLIAD